MDVLKCIACMLEVLEQKKGFLSVVNKYEGYPLFSKEPGRNYIGFKKLYLHLSQTLNSLDNRYWAQVAGAIPLITRIAINMKLNSDKADETGGGLINVDLSCFFLQNQSRFFRTFPLYSRTANIFLEYQFSNSNLEFGPK